MVTLDTEQKPERQHCGRRMCAICRRVKRDKGEYVYRYIYTNLFFTGSLGCKVIYNDDPASET